MKFSFIRETIRMFWSGFSFIPGLWALSRLHHPVVTIFGGKGIHHGDVYAQQSYELGQKLVQNRIAVMTGGGPGIMEAAHCGAAVVHKDKKEQKKWTFGIGVCRINGDHKNPCAPVIFVRYFFIRKWLLTRYSAAYVIFPGGIGTVDELFETLDLLRHKKLPPRTVILVGKSYWQLMLDWYNSAKKEGFITPEREAPFIVSDDIDEVITILKQL